MLEIIIVSWNTRNLLRRCIQSVHASLAGSAISYAITVVDNASSDQTPAMLRGEFPEVRLLESGANLGFAGGNNLALRVILGAGEPGSRGAGKETSQTQGPPAPEPRSGECPPASASEWCSPPA